MPSPKSTRFFLLDVLTPQRTSCQQCRRTSHHFKSNSPKQDYVLSALKKCIVIYERNHKRCVIHCVTAVLVCELLAGMLMQL